jgi:murein DD-endopeptidase MepM/ murein hydrolase activator NlpD
MRSGIIVIAIASFAVTGGTSHVSPPATSPPVAARANVTRTIPAPPPQITAPARTTLEVRVAVDGRAPDAAEVRISDGSELPPVIARTDREGIARFTDLGAGPFELWAVSTQLASPIARIAELTAEPVELALAPASTVSGELIAESAAPQSGLVQLTPLDIDHAIRTAALDAHGRFSLDGIPAGRWRIEATSPGFLQTTPRELRVIDRAESVVVQLERAAAMTGTVVDQRGEPVANATIVVRRQGPRGTRPAAPAFGPMRWVYPFATHRQVPTNDGARFGASRPGTRPAECGDGHCGIDLVMPRGTVVHATGDGEVIVATAALGSEAGRFVAIDHGDGLVTMYMHLDHVRDGLEVGQKIRAGTPVGTVGSTGFDPTKSVPHLHFAITQHRGGRTWYLDPEAMLRHAVVLAAPRDHADPVAVLAPREQASAPPASSITSDARGRFTVTNLEPGSYVAVAFAADLAPGASEPVTVRSDGSEGAVVTLQPGTMVRGRITTRNGPLGGAAIIASTGLGETASKVASTSSNAQGEFTLRALAGTITLSVSAPKYGETSRTIDLTGTGASRADFTLVVEDAALRGLVRSPYGVVAGATVRIVEGPTRRSTTTDAAGQFTLQPVATGRYVLEVSSPEFPSRRLTLESDRFGEVRLEQGGNARVRIGDAREGTGLAGIRVDARGPDGATASRTTDARGLVDLTGLAAGTWTLSVRARTYAPVTREIAIRASRVPEELRIDLAKAATLAGVVRDRRGARVAGARVWSGGAQTVSDADGNFRLSGVSIGSIELAAALGDREGHVALQLAAGDERVTLTIELGE